MPLPPLLPNPLPGPTVATRPNPRALTVFLLISFGLAWAAAVPLVHSGGGQLGGATQLVTAALAMTAPAVAVLVAALAVERLGLRQMAASTGLVLVGPARRLLRYCLTGFLVITLVQVMALILGSSLGLFHADLTGLSGMRAALGIPAAEPALGTALALALFYLLGGLPFVVSEEWGWRGYLEPRLQPLGIWRTMLISGMIWGVWHLPAAFAVGRNPTPWLLVYVVGSVLVGIVLCWLRLRTGSIWPAVVAHCAISGFPGPVLPSWSSHLTMSYEPAQHDLVFGPLGYATWIFYAALIAVLVSAGHFRPNS